MPEPDPRERLAAGHDASTPPDALRLRADAYRPELDAEADQMRRIPDLLTPQQRMALGYHDSAKGAADTLNNRKDQNQ